jgi:hypothetical protein
MIKMKADFSGYATKAGVKCSDGRTILPDAFKHQDKARVPLVWQHGHKDPENVLGHAILENRPDGVYTYGFFNSSVKGQHAKGLVEHKDITMLSIWANQLIERSGNVIHGAIREISLVLSGANPGALIENVTIHHGDGDDTTLDDEAIIYTGVELELEHSTSGDENDNNDASTGENVDDNVKDLIAHAAAATDTSGETIQDVYDSMTPKQQDVLHYMVSQALEEGANSNSMGQASPTETPIAIENVAPLGDPTVIAEADTMMTKAVEMIGRVNTTDFADAADKATMMNKAAELMNEAADKMKEAQLVSHDNLNDGTTGDAIDNKDGVVSHSDTDNKAGDGSVNASSVDNGDNNDNTAGHGDIDNQEGNKMTTTTHNVFEQGENIGKPTVLSHSDMQGIVADAMKNKASLKDTFEAYALAHGIENIDLMFPDAQAGSSAPEMLTRRNEWVAQFLGATIKSPFSRVKTLSADLTLEDARAKGYVKGSLKKEEFIGVTRRVTTPSTIYKKQKLDRDDVIDITDFDVVTWLKAEMRYMLDEELARAILISDGRDVAHEDKINEGNIRPIAKDHELYTTVVTVNISDAASSANEIIDGIVANRKYFRGTGVPNMYTSETYISMMLMLRDSTGRRIYKSLEEIAIELRVREIISVDVMEEEPDIVAVIVNPIDYRIGSDKGGQVAMFDDFDIDYNQYKYLIETRLSGALTKLKSAIVVKTTAAGTDVLVVPTAPGFNPATGALTITNQAGVVYKHDTTVLNAAGSPYTVPEGQTWVVDATSASGYYFATSNDSEWSFTNPA